MQVRILCGVPILGNKMINEIKCYFRAHKWRHIANWSDITGGRGLWQCTCCKKVEIAGSSDFYNRLERKTPRM